MPENGLVTVLWTLCLQRTRDHGRKTVPDGAGSPANSRGLSRKLSDLGKESNRAKILLQ